MRLTKLDKEFIAENLAKCGNLARAAKAAGRSVATVRSAAERDEEFAEALEQAELEYVAVLERAAHKRAVNGVKKGVWYKGMRVGEERVYSDTLLLAKLKAKHPDYRDKSSIEMSGSVDGMSDTERTARLMSLLDAARRRGAETSETDDASDIL